VVPGCLTSEPIARPHAHVHITGEGGLHLVVGTGLDIFSAIHVLTRKVDPSHGHHCQRCFAATYVNGQCEESHMHTQYAANFYWLNLINDQWRLDAETVCRPSVPLFKQPRERPLLC
jgi:hypothetical protein